MTSPPRSSTRLWFVLGLVFAAALAAGAFLFVTKKDDSPPPRRDRGPATPTPAAKIGMDTPLGETDVRIDIARLISEFLADENAANERYINKTIEVSGVMAAVDRSDPEIVTVVVAKQLGSKEVPCACQGKKALEQAAAGRAEGQPIVVRGKFVGQVMMKMVLLNCEIVR